jgi:hypothetical protein
MQSAAPCEHEWRQERWGCEGMLLTSEWAGQRVRSQANVLLVVLLQQHCKGLGACKEGLCVG